MKHLKLFFALFAMLALGVGNAWGENAPVNTVLWGENFAHFGTKTPSNAKTGTGTTIYDGASITYTQSSTKTKGYNEQLAGGTKPELLLSKSNQTWTISGIKTGGATKMSLTFLSNKTTFSVTVSSANLSVSGSQKSWTISLKDGQTDPETFNLIIKNTGSSNARIDNVELKVTVAGANAEPVTTYSVTLNQPANGTISAEGLNAEGKAAKGATITLKATPNTGYKFGAWDVKDANNAAVTVSADGKFTMPESAVTVTASFVAKTQYTIKWNVAEGSVDAKQVYEGDALGNLPTADNCSSGKVFVGWTEATSVYLDGSGIVYAKETDIPNGDKEYNAVYATSGAVANKVDKLNLLFTGASGSTYSSWSGKQSVSDAVYAGNNAGGNNAIQLRYDTSKAAAGIITTTSGGKATKVVISWNSNTADGRTLNVYGNNTLYSDVKDLWDGQTNQGTLLGTIVKGTSTELVITGDYAYIGLRSASGAMYLNEVEITWEATNYSDYSLDCEAHQNPFLTVDETPIDFGTVAQDATVEETLNVSGGYLAEDVTLTISGTHESFFSVNPTTIAKADDVAQDVTITYSPTEIGNHTATLTIKTGDITKEIALSGKVLAPGKWVLVKDVATLSAGDEIIIAAADADYAIGAAASNNYKGAAITKVGETANADASVTVLTVEETGVAEAPFAFKTDSKYLYAASSSSNHLKAQATNNENGQWAITITAEGVASIEAAKSSNRKVMQYNPNSGSPIFACYETASQKPLAIYRNSENVAKPVISGDADFVGSTQVTITAQSGLTVYYTTDDSTPDKTATQYSEPFTINATTTVKAIAYDATDNASAVAEMTFTKHDLVNVATAMALDSGKTAYLSQFEVVYPLKDKSFIYIKDNSGYGLIYDGTLDEQFKAGDRVEGFIGTSSPYKSLPELKAVNKYEDLTITSGVAAEPIEFAAEPTVADVNKYVVFKNVQFDAAVTFETTKATNTTFTIGSETVTLRNNYKYAASLDANKAYDVYGFVATFQQNEGDQVQVQVYFLTAVEAGGVIETYTVAYDANGATGAAPVDETKYQAGQTFYIENQGKLVKEGYEFAGWKYNGTIYEAGKQFTMPAENVTFVAQWEEIVVTPRQDFSAGIWVRVTNADELATDDYVVVAAADLNVAMKSYETGNYCTHMAITKSGKNNSFLTWTQEIGVFQLAEENGNYTFQDVNTKQYLYAAGTGKNNYLKAAGEIPVDETAKQYIWTITIEEGITTVKATSDNRNTLKYNKTSGQERFSCYASGQEDIVLYKYTTDFYTRDVAKNQYGTICLDKGGVPVSGATFYEVAWKNTQTNRVFVDEVVRLKAGVPYVFLPNATQIKIALDGTTAGTASEVNGLQGTFDEIQDGPAGTAGNILEGKHVLYNNAIQKCGGNCQLPAYRAYFLVDKIATTEPAQVPGRRRVALDYQGENQATGLDNIGAPENDAVKVLMNGQMIIIRNGEKFNAQGVKL